MLDEKFFYVAALLNLTGALIYLIATLKGNAKPNRVTWFLWSFAPLIAFAAQIQQGVGTAALLTFSAGFGPLLVFIGSFFSKHSAWKITKFDMVCGTLSLVGLFCWYITQQGNIAIIFGILADLLAYLPTMLKAYKAPETESLQAYLFGTIAGLITLLTLRTMTFAYIAFPLYLFLANGICVAILYFKPKRYFTRS
jgi:hypothetical protein